MQTMGSAAILVGLAVVLSLQILLHLHISGLGARIAGRLKREIDAQARTDAEALKEASAKRVGQIVRSLEAHKNQAVDASRLLHTTSASMRTSVSEQKALAVTFADLLAELREHAALLRVHAAEIAEDERRTVEFLPGSVQGGEAEAEREEATKVFTEDPRPPRLRVPELRPPPVPRGGREEAHDERASMLPPAPSAEGEGSQP